MKLRSRVGQSSFECLEPRIAPASVVRLIDLNGDHLKFTSSVGDLTGHITGVPAADGLHNDYSVDLSDVTFNGANFSATASRAGGGDGQLIVGHINAGANDLGRVSIAGDLGDIDAGSGSATVPALKSLTVNSIGRFGERGDGDNYSQLFGDVKSLVVRHDFIASNFYVTGDLASASIGGSVIGGDAAGDGQIYATGDIGKIAIRHDLRGGDDLYTGAVGAGHNVGSVTVGGSVYGGKGDNSGDIFAAYLADGTIGKVRIGGSLIGADGTYSGTIGGKSAVAGAFHVSLGVVTIGHDIVGANGDFCASICLRRRTQTTHNKGLNGRG